ncbi:MAG TPA: serine/threonine-protein kinase, partial [Xanthomonadaceae bacterium]|nr:serine/threonine-protein kinase [Xanthomonadaceae bacterium]
MNDRVDASKWQRLGVLFDRAVELDAAEQTELLRTLERDDAELAQTLVSLLAADARQHGRATEQSDRVLQSSLAAIDAPSVVVGDRVGPYIVREELGRGGMGVVFRAERADGQVQQEVALKIVKRALLDATARERFLREREIVAAFQHASIARMLDVGETADGSPYLAMELIRGQTITNRCDSRKLDTRHRVEVFLRVCEAVQHAHANLVLHRDLKPSNVLVGEDGLPKLIDFGIAKPLGIVVDDEHQQTATAQRFFSPSNVAPEQLRGERVGVACDVYQLGTLLHELMCGTTVFDATGLTAGQFEQKILEVTPEAPSARAALASDATTQAHGAASPAALARELAGDLDAIVAQALRKSPRERYGSVEQLADDLRRYLDGRPVDALRGRQWYRARKFLRRHAVAVAVSMTAMAMIAAFTGALWVQSQRVAHERDLARQRAKEVQQIARFEADMLKQVDRTQAGRQLMDDMQAKYAAALVNAGVPDGERAGKVVAFVAELQRVNATDAARDLIDRTTLKPAISAIDEQFGNQPVVAATLRQVLADRYVEMGLYDAAMPLQQSALATRRRVLGEDHPDTLQSINGMGELLEGQGKPREAEPYLREALEKRRHVLGEEHTDTVESIGNMGGLLADESKLSQAEPYFREALEKSRRVNGEESRETLRLIGSMGQLLEDQGKLSEAEPLLREAVEKMRHVLGEDNS